MSDATLTEQPKNKIRISIGGEYAHLRLMLLATLALLLAVLPFFAGRVVIQDMFFVLTMLALAQYWNLLAGYGGLVSVGQQAFVGLGAYALFALAILGGVDLLVAIPLTGLLVAIIAIPTAFVVFRLRGAYFAIGTWVVAEVFRLLLAQWKQLGGGTGTSLPKATKKAMAGVDWIKQTLDVKSSAAQDVVAYWAALVLVILTIAIVYKFLRSRHGLALTAIRDAEEAAGAVGVNATLLKLTIYVTAAFGTAMTGALIFLQKSRISPDSAFAVTDWTAFVIFIVVIGGIGTIEGPIVGIIIFFLLQNYLSDFGSLYLMLLGAIAIIVMLFAPRGIWGLVVARYNIQLFPTRRVVDHTRRHDRN